MNIRRLLTIGLFLITSGLPAGNLIAENLEKEEIELPYRILENINKNQVILLGSAHNHVEGVSSIANSIRNLIASAAAIAFEALPDAPSQDPNFPILQSYIDSERYKYLESLAQADRDSRLIWGVLTRMPLPPEIAASMFFLRCHRVNDQQFENFKNRKRPSLDKLILDSLPDTSKSIALENISELNDFRNENINLASAKMLEGAIKASLSKEICTKLKLFDREGDNLIIKRRIADLYDYHLTIECTLYACSGWLNGVAFSKGRNQSLAKKIARHAQEHGRIAAVVGALHLDRRAGLIEELNASGFLEVSTNIVDDDPP